MKIALRSSNVHVHVKEIWNDNVSICDGDNLYLMPKLTKLILLPEKMNINLKG